MAKGTIKAVIADNRDGFVLGQGDDAQGDFLDHAKAALRPGQQEGKVHIPLIRNGFFEVVARKPAVHFREGCLNQVATWGDFIKYRAIKRSGAILARHDFLGIRST